MSKLLLILPVILLAYGCKSVNKGTQSSAWSISVLPSSVRLDPATHEIIDERFILLKNREPRKGSLLKKNWIYDGSGVSLHAARGEYISFQLILTRNTQNTLKNIRINMLPFENKDSRFSIPPAVSRLRKWCWPIRLMWIASSPAPGLRSAPGAIPRRCAVRA